MRHSGELFYKTFSYFWSYFTRALVKYCKQTAEAQVSCLFINFSQTQVHKITTE